MNKRELIQEVQERLGPEATEAEAKEMADYLYASNWLPNDHAAFRKIPASIWEAGLKLITENR